MIVCDSSILVAALCESERHHSACKTLLTSGPFGVWAQGETFNTLTSGKVKPRPSASSVATALRRSIRPRATILHLPEVQMLGAFDEAELRGVRGGAIFDYLHLVTAREHHADHFYTLNTSHFQTYWRDDDPAIVHP